MIETVYVISDLHLGGAPASSAVPAGFQLCPPAARARLVSLLRQIQREHPDPGAVLLVINGDFVDFLAEPERDPDGSVCEAEDGRPVFSAFTADPIQAGLRFASAVRNTEAGLPESCRFFGALSSFVQAGYGLTLLVGNHDLELTLPNVREELARMLTAGRPARLAWLLDGEALDLGPVIIEHGNRYDPWNWVDHGALRRLRAQLSRGEQPGLFNAPAGSRMVARVMNPLKERYRFIDVLKPETEVVVPVLAALEPGAINAATDAVPLLAEKTIDGAWMPRGRPARSELMVSRRVDAREGAAPDDETTTLEGPNSATAPKDLLAAAAVEEANRWGLPRAALQVSSMGAAFRERLTDVFEGARLDRLSAALRGLQGAEEAMFRVGEEQDPWLSQAKRLSEGGRLVVFGHTHIAKDVAIPETGGRYLNTGTWCPVMRLPPGLWSGPDASRRALLARLVRDLRDGHHEDWCVVRPTYARIELRGGRVVSAGLHEMTPDGPRAIGREETFPPRLELPPARTADPNG
ncbi:MAG: metallophosphoesterase [Pseudomonadota bacterium]|nr:metallophosphoesterase [Pseudomonadota bacterium]